VLYQLSYLGLEMYRLSSGRILHAEMKIVKQRSKWVLQSFYMLVMLRLLNITKIREVKRNQKGDETMFKMTTMFKKIVLAALVLATNLAAHLFSNASTANPTDPATPPATTPAD
jgi:hypothetical protein